MKQTVEPMHSKTREILKMTGLNAILRKKFRHLFVIPGIVAGAAIGSAAAQAQTLEAPIATPAQRATYADLVTLAERSDLVIRVEIRRQITVKPERAPGLAPGFARLYIEAQTLALLSGPSAVGESLNYLVDVPLDARGRPERLKDREMLLFADLVPSRPGAIQLTGRNAQLDYSPELEARIRPVLAALVARDKPPVVNAVSDALAVQGTLVGESETQIFLATQDRSPVSISVLRRPGQRPVWGVSWGEIIDSSARPPQPDTLRWYRLACTLPPRLPASANLGQDANARRIAEADYSFVIEQLGPCRREITQEF